MRQSMEVPELIRPHRAPRALRIGLAGCGVVGGELARLIFQHADPIQRNHGVRLEIARVLVRDRSKTRQVDLPDAAFTDDLDTFLRTPADVVVEAIGGVDPAERIARETLDRGARLVTANKALIAAVGDELHAVARRTGGSLDFEAAVGGGVPIIRTLREALSEGPVHRIRAILNGTTNYILTLVEDGAPFRQALLEAQRNGFAEADPTRDLDGTDASDKIRILAWLAYGIPPRSVLVRRRGILPDPDRLAGDAVAAGGCVRLLAECVSADGVVSASVEPVIVPSHSEFGRVRREQNYVTVDFGWSGPVSLAGPGAGALPTASAVLGDLIRTCGPLPHGGSSAVARLEDPPKVWLVSADGGSDLLRHLAAAGLEGNPLPSDVHERVLIGCRWSSIETGLVQLRAAGLRPLVTRLDMPDQEALLSARPTHCPQPLLAEAAA